MNIGWWEIELSVINAAHIATLASSLHFTFTQLPRKGKWIELRACAHEYQELVGLVTTEKNGIHVHKCVRSL